VWWAGRTIRNCLELAERGKEGVDARGIRADEWLGLRLGLLRIEDAEGDGLLGKLNAEGFCGESGLM
jgi:hypothetical protein